MNNYYKILRYAGSKFDYLDKLLPTFNTTCSTFVEPFVGSGSVFINTDYEHYIINDKDDKLMSIYASIKLLPYSEYVKTIHFIQKKFGDISRNKSSYYAFRDFVNDKYFFEGIYLKDEFSGLFLAHLYNSCINSLARFGPNGFNQSYGRRWQHIDKLSYEIANEKLQRTALVNTDGMTLLNEIDLTSEHQIFIDPPYFTRPSASYASVNEDSFTKLLDMYKQIENISYTDSYHRLHASTKDFNTGSFIIREMGSISPNRNSKSKENTYELCMYRRS